MGGSDPAVLVGTTRSGVARLVRIPLDGRNTPQVLAERPTGDGMDAPGWTVAPDGGTAVFVPDDSATITLIDLASSVARDVAMAGRIDGYDLRAVWSADGSRVAVGDRGWSVIDIASGTRAHLRSSPDEVRGFDVSGRLVLERRDETTESDATWTFRRWDPASPETPPVAIPIDEAAVALAAPSTVSVPLRATVEEVQPENGRSGLGLRSLLDGEVRRLEGVPDDYGRAIFDPSGRLAVAIVRDQVFLSAPDRPAITLGPNHKGEEWYLDETPFVNHHVTPPARSARGWRRGWPRRRACRA